MNPRFREAIVITLSMGVIFACGWMLGHRQAPAPCCPAQPLGAKAPSWEQTTESALTASLHLTPFQRDHLRPQLVATAQEIQDIRVEALRRFQISLLDFIDRAAPSLDATQQAKLAEDRLKLQHAFAESVQSTASTQPVPSRKP